MLQKVLHRSGLLFLIGGLLLVPALAFAAVTPDLTQTINAGILATDILDASRNPVTSPAAAMSTTAFSFDCQTSTGTLGSSAQRLYVSNGKGDNSAWTLTMAATDGATGAWKNSGATESYAFNNAAASGCTGGQLTVDPSVATITADCSSSVCTGATVSKGSSAGLTGATPATLMTGGTNADIYRGYLTGVGLSQKIPGEQMPDNYSINMTLTVTAS